MHLLCALLLFFQAPYWETKKPKDWSNRELLAVLQQSPWASQALSVHPHPEDPEIPVYLASATPCAMAEAELRERKKMALDPLAQEYRIWTEDNPGKYIVLAVRLPDASGLTDESEMREL